jgi:hypothetical protein
MADSSEFKKNPRSYALGLVEEKLIDADTMLKAALGYMSFDDVRDMLDDNEMSPRFIDEEEDEDEEDEDEEDEDEEDEDEDEEDEEDEDEDEEDEEDDD